MLIMKKRILIFHKKVLKRVPHDNRSISTGTISKINKIDNTRSTKKESRSRANSRSGSRVKQRNSETSNGSEGSKKKKKKKDKDKGRDEN